MNENEQRCLDEIGAALARDAPALGRALSEPVERRARLRSVCRRLLVAFVILLVLGAALESPPVCLLAWAGLALTGSILLIVNHTDPDDDIMP